MSKYKKDLGRFGERIAEKYLIKSGYDILERNFTIRGGELDLITKKNGIYCFIEVKTRIEDNFYMPEDSVGINKKRFLIKTAKIWLYRNHIDDIYWQIDVISIVLSKDKQVKQLIHFANAIY